MRFFRDIRKFIAPRWLTEGDGELVGRSLGLVQDAFVERVRLGLLARFPETAPPDALAAMGRDRRVTRGRSESLLSYASRLKAWLDDRKTAGNAFALMQKLSEYTGAGPSFRTVDKSGNWYSRAVDGTRTYSQAANWNWDSGDSAARWSQFWVIVYPRGLWSVRGNYGDAGQTWGATGETWGATITQDEVASIRAIVADWKPAGSRCAGIILAFDTASFDPASPEPDGLWGPWSKTVNGIRVPSRLATARYLEGVG